MAAIPVTIDGILYDKLNRTTQNVVLIGEISLTGLSVGGGPIYPPTQPPTKPPVDPDAHPSHPIALPGDPWWPPDAPQPPQLPPPGSPPVVLPGPTPVTPIVPPPAIIVDYPGVGKVLVPKPA